MRTDRQVSPEPKHGQKKRREAKKWAEDAGRYDAAVQWEKRQRARVQMQTSEDDQWRRLLDHQAQAVHEALEEAFEDNQSPAACIDVGTEDGVRYATVLILFGPVSLVPGRQPAFTPAGRPTLHKRNKTERNNFYVAALGSTVLATVREGFAVTPSVDEFRVIVLRKDPQALNPDKYVEWIYAARFPRTWTASLPWNTLFPAETLLQAKDARMERRGTTAEVFGMPLSDEPGLREIVRSVREAIA